MSWVKKQNIFFKKMHSMISFKKNGIDFKLCFKALQGKLHIGILLTKMHFVRNID